LERGETIHAFRSDGVIKIIRKLDAAAEMARALEDCLPALVGIANRRTAEAPFSGRSRSGRRPAGPNAPRPSSRAATARRD
jgi:hypothetical protein